MFKCYCIKYLKSLLDFLVMDSKHELLLICGPSGSGKSSFLQRLLSEFPDKFGFSVSHTTRKPRTNEINGTHYYFVTNDEFEKKIFNGCFIEHTMYNGNHYGTSNYAVQKILRDGKICLLDVDVDGAKQIANKNYKQLKIFVMPPSMKELEDRLKSRNTETDQSIYQRLHNAATEMKDAVVPGNFHKIIINDNFDEAYIELRAFILENINIEEKERNLVYK